MGTAFPRRASRTALSENTRKILAHGAAAARRVLEAAGAIEDYGQRAESATSRTTWGRREWEPIPRTSVVNAWNQAHEVPNLFVVDGSSFATSAA